MGHKLTINDLDPNVRPYLDIPDAGSFFDYGRDMSYRVAKAGYLPTVQISQRRWVVPTAALRQMLGLPAVPDNGAA